MSDLIKLFNPANAASLTQVQIEGLQKLTSPQIKELALAYPNMTMQRAYLLVIESTKPIDQQMPRMTTFENLWNLREKNAQRQWVAYGFRGSYKAKNNAPVRAKRTEVLDLSETELLSLPGFKTATKQEPPQEVKVTKINKIPVNPLGKSLKQIESLESVKSEFQKKLIKVPAKKTPDKKVPVPANKKSNIK